MNKSSYEFYSEAVNKLNSVIEEIQIKCDKRGIDFSSKVPPQTIKKGEMLVSLGQSHQIQSFALALEYLYSVDIELNT
ncbi:MAG: hypothetical protein CL772_04170 [Chloroflexi bacterium]|nr:hypothetical protein [Chloroflexota bacterium]MBK90355.1 hypothetical protein [Chloroflexota bacterium]|tara:strand:+ start:20090 stop:20323 length:234 start_codon:yes stop_codon:yes gene_type:complete